MDTVVAQSDSASGVGIEVAAAEKPARKRRRLPRVRIEASAWIYIGIAIAAAGLGSIAFSWAKVAGLLNVALQLPYLVSAGILGLCLVTIGVGIAHFAAQHKDAGRRWRELDRLAGLLGSIADELGASDEPTTETKS